MGGRVLQLGERNSRRSGNGETLFFPLFSRLDDVKHAATNFSREQLDNNEKVEEDDKSTTARHGRAPLPVRQHIYIRTHAHRCAVADERGYMAARVLLLSVLITEVLKPACAAGACYNLSMFIFLHNAI